MFLQMRSEGEAVREGRFMEECLPACLAEVSLLLLTGSVLFTAANELQACQGFRLLIGRCTVDPIGLC